MSPRPSTFYHPPSGISGGGGGLGNTGLPNFLPSISTGAAPAALRTVSDDGNAGAISAASPVSSGDNPSAASSVKSDERLSVVLAQMFADRKAKNLPSDFVLVGLLFARPSDDFAAKNIIPELDYFDTRSGEFMDFFCVGYSKQKSARSTRVIKVKAQQWWFDNDSFNKFRAQIMRQSNWKYSGETELLLVNARSSESGGFLDYSSAIPCRLEDMQNDKAFKNIKTFFENVFTYAEDPGSDPAFDLSDLFGKDIMIGAAKKTILKLLLKSLAPEYDKARYFVLEDLSKKN